MKEAPNLLNTMQLKELCSQLSELIKTDYTLTERIYRSRQLLENLYKELTRDVNVAFTGLYARMQFVHEVTPLKPELIDQLQYLRLFTNKVIHKDDFEFGELEFGSCVRVLSEAIEHYSGCKIPGDVRQYLLNTPVPYFTAFGSITEQTVSSLYGVVTDWKTSPSHFSNLHIEITCQTSEGSEVKVTLFEKKDNINPGKKWTLLDKALWKYGNICFYDLTVVKGSADRFQSTYQTVVVLEPDFLVDISSISDCFQQNEYYPELFIINRFFSDVSTPALVKGKCVNYVFDALVSDPESSFCNLCSAFLAEHSMLHFALGDKAWEGIFREIERDHYPQLKAQAIDLHKQNCQLEPSFISLMYGLHGRLDVMVLPGEKSPKYSIIELKSGSAPQLDLWKGHQMQVVGYNLILKEVYGRLNIANSSIFYSRSADSPLRHVVNHVTLEQNFLMCRNRILGIMQKLAVNPAIFVEWLKTSNRVYSSKFTSEKVSLLRGVINALDTEEITWLQDKLSFLFREIWAVKTGAFNSGDSGCYGFSSLWNSSITEKKAQYRIIDGLWIESIRDDIVNFLRQETDTVSNLREGDIVLLYNEKLAINKQQLLRGTIMKLTDSHIIVKTRSNIKNDGQFDTYTQWSIEPDLMESSLYSSLSSIYAFISADRRKRQVLLGRQAPAKFEADTSSLLSWREDVISSLTQMVKAGDYYLVQGPPGTGKTSCLLMNYLQYILNETDKKLVILSYTNRAVEEICQHLNLQQIAYYRFGKNAGQTTVPAAEGMADKAAASPDASSSLAIGKVDSHLLPSAHQYQLPMLPAIAENRVFVSTVHSFGAISADLLHHVHLDEMLVDEASQIMEHNILGWMARLPKSILIGDQNQLPPVILQQNISNTGSVFEQFISYVDNFDEIAISSMLTLHYRMHQSIAGMVGANYHNRLLAGKERQFIRGPWFQPLDSYLQILLEHRVIWVDTLSAGQSKVDQFQAAWIANFVHKLSACLHPATATETVGIISPFRAQVQCIRSQLGERFQDVTVDTVERFQGSEKECIIISYPIRYVYELGMVQSLNASGLLDRKLNVALSRAKEQLIILGNSHVLIQSPHFRSVYQYIKKHGTVITL